MIKATTGGGTTDRFYVMALKNVDEDTSTTHTWYKSKSGSLPQDKKVDISENDFGQGKINTEYWISKWNQDDDENKDENDIWGIIQEQTEYPVYSKTTPDNKWFVPSKSEWSAFGDMCYTKVEITSTDYGDFRTWSLLLVVFTDHCVLRISH